MKISKQTIKEQPGIYFIKNLVNNKIYIGQSKNVYRRAIYHRHELNNNKHSNSHLQHSYNKYKQENFIFGVLEYCDISLLTEKEKYYISIQKYEIYNVRDAEEVPLRQKRIVTEEQRLKLSNSMKGKIPKNINEFREAKKRRIVYYENDELIKIFDSCVKAAEYFKIKPKLFNYYIGKKRVQKSKYFSKNAKIEYYD